jgi:hypothetical protein
MLLNEPSSGASLPQHFLLPSLITESSTWLTLLRPTISVSGDSFPGNPSLSVAGCNSLLVSFLIRSSARPGAELMSDLMIHAWIWCALAVHIPCVFCCQQFVLSPGTLSVSDDTVGAACTCAVAVRFCNPVVVVMQFSGCIVLVESTVARVGGMLAFGFEVCFI